MKKNSTTPVFSRNCFTDKEMKKYLSRSTYKKIKTLQKKGFSLDTPSTKELAQAIKKWAQENNVTHFAHWFQPLRDNIAEKHDCFLNLENGEIIETFTEKALIKSETDASSFSTGGKRATSKSMGYLIWDCTSPIFFKKNPDGYNVLYIPTAFCSYDDQALDYKTPLLRATQSLNENTLGVLKLLGDKKTKKIIVNVGYEQEYFLVPLNLYNERLDLRLTGRTLFGTAPTKSQAQHNHYFSLLNNKITAFIKDLTQELWQIGIAAKIKHNEVAPAQHEVVSIYTNANTTNDQNQMLLKLMQSTAAKHGLQVLFHEKPFQNINGSGKHNNFSISTDTGINLLDAREENKMLFLIFFTSLIAAIDKFSSLLQLSVASYENDLRLGGFEAPPNIISVYIGDELLHLLEAFEKGKTMPNQKHEVLDHGVKSLPLVFKDAQDRNRTSPFAFSVNKFEFRMVGSSQNLGFPNAVLCTILSQQLMHAKNFFEQNKDDINSAVVKLIKQNIKKHKKIIFNENGYSKEWIKEAQKRKIKHFKTALDGTLVLSQREIINLFKQTNVLNENEIELRKNIMANLYLEKNFLEIKTAQHLLSKQIIPALQNTLMFENKTFKTLTRLEIENQSTERLLEISTVLNQLLIEENILSREIEKHERLTQEEKESHLKQILNPSYSKARQLFDSVENKIPQELKPFPDYNDLLFS